MPTIIEIEDDQVRYIDRRIIRTAPVTEVLALLRESAPFMSPRLPRNVAFAATDRVDTNIRLIIEKPPRTEAVILAYSRNPREDRQFYYPDDDRWIFPVQIPWEYYYFYIAKEPQTVWGNPTVAISSFRLYWSPVQVTKPTDYLCGANLSNIYANTEVCVGSTTHVNTSTADTVNDIVNTFYDSPFNQDLGYRSGPSRSMSEWAKDDWSDLTRWPNWTWGQVSVADVLRQNESLNDNLGQPAARTTRSISAWWRRQSPDMRRSMARLLPPIMAERLPSDLPPEPEV